MRINNMLSKLNKVRKSGKDYMACCPAHDDQSPSLSISETADGKILLHCFAGCDVAEVLSAMGVEMADLFPEPLKAEYGKKRKRVYFDKDTVFKIIEKDLLVFVLVANDLMNGYPINMDDRNQIAVSRQRIINAYEVLYGKSIT